MYCPKCGANNVDAARFCAECGFRMSHEERVYTGVWEDSRYVPSPASHASYTRPSAMLKAARQCFYAMRRYFTKPLSICEQANELFGVINMPIGLLIFAAGSAANALIIAILVARAFAMIGQFGVNMRATFWIGVPLVFIVSTLIFMGVNLLQGMALVRVVAWLTRKKYQLTMMSRCKAVGEIAYIPFAVFAALIVMIVPFSTNPIIMLFLSMAVLGLGIGQLISTWVTYEVLNEQVTGNQVMTFFSLLISSALLIALGIILCMVGAAIIF